MGIKFIFFALIWTISHGSIGVIEEANLIKTMRDHLECSSIILLNGVTDNISHIISLKKSLNDPPKFSTGVWNFRTFTRNMYSDVVSFPTNALVVMKYSPPNIKELSLVSKKISLAPFDWFILTTKSSLNEESFKNVMIPINCRFVASIMTKNHSIEILEVYQISKHSKHEINEVGSCNLTKGSCNLKKGIWNRRTNLKRHEFRFAVHNVSNDINPCKTIEIDNGKTMIQCAVFQLWRTLGQVLNFTSKYVVIEDCYKNGTMGLSTPMLDMIRTGGADTGEDGYIWSSSRLIHNRFLWPLFHSKVILVTKTPMRTFNLSSYVRPFVTDMWLAILGWLLLSGIVINLTKFLMRKGSGVREFIGGRFECIENAFVPLAAICYQSTSSVPKEAAIRLTYLMIYVIPVVFIPSYSGSVISSLSFPAQDIPFNNIQEFIDDGTYKLNAVNNTFFQFFLMTDEKFEAIRENNLVSKEPALSYEAGFRDVCSKKVTYIFEWPILSRYSFKCNVFKIHLSLAKIFSSMAVRKNFPYIELFNRHIQKLTTSGLNMKLLEKIIMKYFKHEINFFPKNCFLLKPFGFDDVLPVFTILLGGILLSILILIAEIRISKSKP